MLALGGDTFQLGRQTISCLRTEILACDADEELAAFELDAVEFL